MTIILQQNYPSKCTGHLWQFQISKLLAVLEYPNIIFNTFSADFWPTKNGGVFS